MRLADREWILYCHQCGEWTALHRFLPKRGHFQGEHSLVLNSYMNSDLLLGQFMLHHADHHIVSIPDLTEEYTQIMIAKPRFMESLIDTLVEERIQQQRDQQADVESRIKAGYQTLLALRGIFTERLKELDAQHPDDPGQARVHLGKTLGIEWCREQTDHLLQFPRNK